MISESYTTIVGKKVWQECVQECGQECAQECVTGRVCD